MAEETDNTAYFTFYCIVSKMAKNSLDTFTVVRHDFEVRLTSPPLHFPLPISEISILLQALYIYFPYTPLFVTLVASASCMNHKVLSKSHRMNVCGRLLYQDKVSQRSIVVHGRQLHFPKIKLKTDRKNYSYFGFGTHMYNNFPEQFQNMSCSNFKIKKK